MSDKTIVIKGAAQHNLKNIDVAIPRDRLVVITGLSGSGKSSLAFDTIYAEGQRRYVESLSAYARQFLEQMQKPDVEYVEGLPPTISIEQRAAGRNPRSTVATQTEIYDYLRLLFARVGKPHCPECGRPIAQQTAQQIADVVLNYPPDTRVMIISPLIRGRKGEHKGVLDDIKREGFVRARVDGEVVAIDEVPEMDKKKAHTVEAVIDRLVIHDDIHTRLHESVETALRLGDGLVTIAREQNGKWIDNAFSERYACSECNVSIEELTPRMFSFNSPYGACPTCDGLGVHIELDENLVIPDKSLSLGKGLIEPFRKMGPGWSMYYSRYLRRFARRFGVRRDTPFEKMPAATRKLLLYGTGGGEPYDYDFDGVIPHMKYQFDNTDNDNLKARMLEYMTEQDCLDCNGGRLRPEALAVTIAGQNIHAITSLSVEGALGFFRELQLGEEETIIARQVLKEIRERLDFLNNVGLSYLTLNRNSGTLSGGESQRIRLATQVGSGLVGVCYVLDEPSIGLHPRDNDRLLHTLRKLQGLGNTVIVVEHDSATMREADHIIDMGPGAGVHGGEIVAQGRVEEIIANPRSLTGAFLGGTQKIGVPAGRRELSRKNAITVKAAGQHNLKNIDAVFPLGGIVCVTGVSGSGKSTLVGEILVRALRKQIYGSKDRAGKHKSLTGVNRIDKVVEVDQSPIGRTPRSNPSTYVGVFTEIRDVFAKTKEAKVRGYLPGRFSFNVKGGRCEACEGQGTKRIEMHFLPDIYVTCEQCKGQRFNRETLEIKYKGASIADVLEMTVEEALDFFKNFPKASRVIKTLNDVGLGYIRLGQPSTTLSGGEAQRVKLASELGKRSTGSTFYVLDEPTTGLHFADVRNLLNVLGRLADMGNTVVVIEHNLDVIKSADYVIDLGPEGGDAGGYIVAQGTPEEVARCEMSYTGQFLRQELGDEGTEAQRHRAGEEREEDVNKEEHDEESAEGLRHKGGEEKN